MTRRFRKDDIETRYDRGTHYPTINIKHWPELRNVKFPIALGMSAPRLADGTVGEFTTSYTDAGFTREWIEDKEEEDDRAFEGLWQMVCEDGFEQLTEEAKEIFGNVDVYQDGRSGGWAVIHGLDDVESWDAIMVAKWGRLVKYAESALSYLDEAFVTAIYMNAYEWEQEQIAEQGRAVADLVIAGGH